MEKTEEEIEGSNYPLFQREGGYEIKLNCPNNCEKNEYSFCAYDVLSNGPYIFKMQYSLWFLDYYLLEWMKYNIFIHFMS